LVFWQYARLKINSVPRGIIGVPGLSRKSVTSRPGLAYARRGLRFKSLNIVVHVNISEREGFAFRSQTSCLLTPGRLRPLPGAVQEVGYFLDSPCICSRFVETWFLRNLRKCRIKEAVRTSFSNFSDRRLFLAYARRGLRFKSLNLLFM
jgi:hypothetical protein